MVELVELMDEFGLAEAKLEGDGWKLAFERHRKVAFGDVPVESAYRDQPSPEASVPAPEAPGTPVTSPMNGIFYASPSPSAPPFVTEGEPVTAGQVVGLIEAMKVFNEITAPVSGRAGSLRVQSGQLVQPGDVLLMIEH